MKNTFTLFIILMLAILSWQCTKSGTTIEGKISNAQNLQAFVDHVVLGKASNVLGKTTLDNAGNFSINFPEGLEEGVYNLRIGAQRMNLILNGDEKLITLEGDLNRMQNYDIKVNGSSDSQAFVNIVNNIVSRRYTVDDIRNVVDSASNPYLGAYVAYISLSGNPNFLDIQKNALNKLNQTRPGSEFGTGYANFISSLESQFMAQQSAELIQVGQPAPDIKLQSPNGKTYALSDLKGKVVLLDFWASWCGPCRRENPNVVKVYNKYNSKGFEIFSVSLDGVDSQTAQRYASTGQDINGVIANSKQRWVQAIEQDGLVWPYHVSDLKKWEAAPAALYGVHSIPRTFLIDREGKIAAINLRGAAAIEAELLKFL
ncbi:MAG: TlpA family protein disulfide reductase [Saprospiraceae bacterium]|nr:TlpA family protein disulfide reductase [Saprospiraceae bacterium]